MKPEIRSSDFYDVLFDCVDYVSYYKDIDDKVYNNVTDFLRTIAFILNDESINLVDYEKISLNDFKKLLIEVIQDSEV